MAWARTTGAGGVGGPATVSMMEGPEASWSPGGRPARGIERGARLRPKFSRLRECEGSSKDGRGVDRQL